MMLSLIQKNDRINERTNVAKAICPDQQHIFGWGQGIIMVGYIWATSWENLFMLYANNNGTDQSAHPRSLISAFIVRCLDSIIPLVSNSEISSLYLASVAAQAGLSLPLSKTPKTGLLVTSLI